MIGTISIKCNAAHPEIALPTIYTHADSPSSIRIIDVPKKIGNWQITSVYVDVIYPDGAALNKQCVLTGGAWVATIEGNDTVGETKNGFTILANGTDELGNDVSGYVLGVGGVKVIQSNPSVDPEEQYTLMRLYEQEPTELKDGATFIDDGHLAVYADGDVVKCANESDLEDLEGVVDGKLSKSGDEMTGNLTMTNQGKIVFGSMPQTGSGGFYMDYRGFYGHYDGSSTVDWISLPEKFGTIALKSDTTL